VKDKEELIACLRQAPSVALVSHVSPDGDCIGTMLAVGLALEKLGKEAIFFNPDPVPRNLRFLPGAERVKASLQGLRAPVLLFVDCTDIERTGIDKELIPADTLILNLDHHVSNRAFGRWNWVEPGASATGELAYFLIRELPVKMDQDIATNLYTAIVTDTGSFQYSNTTAQTHRLAAELLDAGIDLAHIHHTVFDQKPLAWVRLLQRALASLELDAGGQLALMTLSWKDFQESGADDSISEGLTNYARTVEGVEVAALVREVEDGCIRVSLRSNCWLDVSAVAAQFGGGGHRRAAGCTFVAALAEAKEAVRRSLKEALVRGRDH